ncbi:MAG: zinc-binding dehydrogenase [Burkholderiales bacterium]|nr:zinc-binding dehydrogenase [Burkholderiales bacterium]
MGAGARCARHRHRLERGKSARCARTRLRIPDRRARLPVRRRRQAADRRARRRGHLRRAGAVRPRPRTWRRSRSAGTAIRHGEASGPHRGFPDLAAKSATLSRPVLFHYSADRATLREMSERVFAALRAGTIRVEIRHRWPLAAAAEAHRALEARRTIGPIVLLA